jgi:hypothetical protein
MNDNSATDPPLLTHLRRQMAECLSLEEVKILCFDLAIPFDELPGAALSPKITSLLRVVGRDGRWPDLLAALSHAYPATIWPTAAELEAVAITDPHFADEPDQPGVTARAARARLAQEIVHLFKGRGGGDVTAAGR